MNWLINYLIRPSKIQFDDETSKFMAMEGIKRILKEI